MKALDRKLKGVGRIQRAYGNDNPVVIEAIGVVITELYKDGEHDRLRDIRDRKVTLRQAYAKWKNRNGKRLPTSCTLHFSTAAFDWLDGYGGISASTREHYRDAQY